MTRASAADTLIIVATPVIGLPLDAAVVPVPMLLARNWLSSKLAKCSKAA